MRLLAGQVTVFQNFCGAIYIFRPKGIDLVNDSQELADKHSDITSDKSIWVLADSPPNSMILHETNWFPIYASSPREENYKHWKKHVNPDVLYMNAWSWSEVVANRELCLPGGTMRSLAYFHMIFSLYGPVARTIFHLILPPLQNDEEDQIRFKEDFARYEELIEKKAAQTVLANDYLFIEDTPSAISHTGSHTLTLILPTSPIKSAQPKQIQRSYQLTPITNHVLSRIAQAAVRRDAEKGKAFFNQVMNRYPQVFGSLQGVVFETLVHRLLSLGPTLWLYDLPLTHGRTPPPVEILISLELSESREFANLENLGSQLRLRKNSPNIHPKSLNTYLRPTIGNLGAIDALALIDPSHIGWRKKPASYDPSLPTLVLFQCTVSRDHPISLVALNKVLDAVPANGTKNPVIFLWVLPGERIRKIINSEVRAGGSKHIFRPQLYKDAAGCKAVEVRQMITTFSTKRLWGFAEWVIGNDRIALESKGIEKKEIQQLAEFTKDAQYTGEAVVKGQRVVSNNVWHVLSSTTPGGANT
ncbi:hypothetical protein L211DRAFT_339162 [Terfezia boudieri ATCC MYA-4762]|nr:hypothetical protein L211DRAFT_339162 [Terfezia boudieri ATCC MYA-4762]